jgi:hypothetical protein
MGKGERGTRGPHSPKGVGIRGKGEREPHISKVIKLFSPSLLLSNSAGINITILRKVNMHQTLTNDK